MKKPASTEVNNLIDELLSIIKDGEEKSMPAFYIINEIKGILLSRKIKNELERGK